jgi:multimeric flavodoxin WrbA
MKVLLVNSSPHENGCTFTALNEMAKRLNEQGIETEIFQLSRSPIAGCIACGSCAKTGKCFKDDKVNEFASMIDEADGFVFGSPVYYAGASGQLMSFMDRLFYSSSKRMEGKPACAVVSCRRGGASAAFDNINKYFLMCNMPVVPSQYWNQVHGRCAEDVLKDEEGLQTMRTLADNMAWLLKCIELGKQNGINVPEREPKIRTNFIS